jgi:hypothetical protein
MTIMSRASHKTSKGFHIFCAVFGVGVGFLVAALVMSLMDAFADVTSRGMFVLVWIIAAVIFYAWPMSIAARHRAVMEQRAIMKERLGDLEYEPPGGLPKFLTSRRRRR